MFKREERKEDRSKYTSVEVNIHVDLRDMVRTKISSKLEARNNQIMKAVNSSTSYILLPPNIEYLRIPSLGYLKGVPPFLKNW